MDIRSAATVVAQKQRGPFIHYVHLFRGVAILLIVLIHVSESYLIEFAGRESPAFQPVFDAIEILLHDSTIFFTLISGILFVHVYSHRPLAYFVKSRALNVILPYLVLTVLLTMLRSWWPTISAWAADKSFQSAQAQLPSLFAAIDRDIVGGANSAGLLAQIGHNIISGHAVFTLWYLPVVFVLYVASPFVFAMVRARRLRWIAFALVAFPLFSSRTEDTVTVSTLGYFLGVYTLGMLVALDLERSLDYVDSRLGWFAMAAIVATVVLIAAFATSTLQVGFVSVTETAFFIQKTALAGIIVVALRRWARRPDWLRDTALGALATWAFGIYFIHPLLMFPMLKFLYAILPHSQPLWLLGVDGFAAYVVLVALCAAAIVLAHGVLGRRSRYLIGA